MKKEGEVKKKDLEKIVKKEPEKKDSKKDEEDSVDEVFEEESVDEIVSERPVFIPSSSREITPTLEAVSNIESAKNFQEISEHSRRESSNKKNDSFYSATPSEDAVKKYLNTTDSREATPVLRPEKFLDSSRDLRDRIFRPGSVNQFEDDEKYKDIETISTLGDDSGGLPIDSSAKKYKEVRL